MDKNIGKKLDGRYEITELIGEGGMADVYKAVDVVDNKTIAVKILKKEFAESEEFLRRFPKHQNKIVVCGDASGDFRHASSEFTNYMIIRRALEAYGYKFEFRLRPFNPPILSRIQAFNARVCNAKGERHIFVSKKCKWLLHNMYNLSFKEGTSIVDVPTLKTIKNDRDSKFLEHPFDSASYLVDYFYPIK